MEDEKKQDFYYYNTDHKHGEESQWENIKAISFIDVAKKLSNKKIYEDRSINFDAGYIIRDVMIKDSKNNIRCMSVYGNRYYSYTIYDHTDKTKKVYPESYET